MLKNTFKQSLTLCVLMVVMATISTYSQETAPKDKPPAAMTLPAENIELIDINGSAITATVLSITDDKLSIVIRTKEGKEMPIPMTRLNAATIEKLTGRKTTPAIRPANDKAAARAAQIEASKRWNAEKAIAITAYSSFSNSEENKKYQGMLPKDAVEFLLADTETSNMARQAILRLVKYNHDQRICNDANFKTPMDVISELQLPSLQDEVISLRPVLEKSGIKAMKQQGNTCTTYAGMYLTQYWQAVTSKKVITRTEFLNVLEKVGNPNAEFLFDTFLVKALADLQGKKPNVLYIETQNGKLNRELMKHMLRKGRPIVISESGGPGKMSHELLCIGFTTENGNTTFQCIDSNGLHIDSGYRTAKSYSGGLCIWFD